MASLAPDTFFFQLLLEYIDDCWPTISLIINNHSSRKSVLQSVDTFLRFFFNYLFVVMRNSAFFVLFWVILILLPWCSNDWRTLFLFSYTTRRIEKWITQDKHEYKWTHIYWQEWWQTARRRPSVRGAIVPWVQPDTQLLPWRCVRRGWGVRTASRGVALLSHMK